MFQNATILHPVAEATAGPGRDRSLLPWPDMPAVLRRRMGWVVAGLLAGLVGGGLLAAGLPRSFVATTELLVQPTDLRAAGNAVSQPATEPENSVAQIESVARLVSSSAVLGRVIAAQGLDRDPEFIGGPSPLRALSDQLKAVLGNRTPPPDPAALALQQLDKRLFVRRTERTYVIDVSVRSKDPAKAARLANAIVDETLAVQTARRADATKRLSDALSGRLGELRDRLAAAEEAVQRYKVEHKLVMANGQLVNEQQIAGASAQLLAAQTRTADARARLDEVTRAGRDPGAAPETLQSQTVTNLRSQLAQASKQAADAMATLGPRHPQMAQIQSQVTDLRRSLNGEIERIRAAAREAYDRARSNEDSLRANLDRRQQAGTEVSAAMAQLRELQQTADAQRTIYQAFLERARETAEQERVDTTNAFVMSRAEPPIERAFPPSNAVLLAGALVLGLGAGLAMALLREFTDARLFTVGRVEAVTGAPVLAQVERARRGRLLRRTARDGGEPLATLLADLQGSVSEQSRILLLVGARDGAGLAALSGRIALAAVEGGERTVLARIGTAATGDAASLAGIPGLRVVDVGEAGGPRQAADAVAELRASLGREPVAGLAVVAAPRSAMVLQRWAEFADDIVLVVQRGRTTEAEARAMAERLRNARKRLRGSLLLAGQA